MTYGHMTTEQRRAVADAVRGETVIDLGCGTLGWAAMLIGECKASRVIAVDNQPVLINLAPDKIEVVECRFKDYDGEVPDIAFLSWPVNRPLPGLLRLVEQAKIVIYLGQNTDGSACGWPDLFEHFSGRALALHMPHRRSTLTVYGEPVEQPRELTGEEIAARFYWNKHFITYDYAEYAAEDADAIERLGWRA